MSINEFFPPIYDEAALKALIKLLQLTATKAIKEFDMLTTCDK